MPKYTRSAQGSQVMSLKAKDRTTDISLLKDTKIPNESRHRCRSVPAAGAILKTEDGEQLSLNKLMNVSKDL